MNTATAERPTFSHFSCEPVSLLERTGCNWPMNDNAKAMLYCNNEFMNNNPRTVYCEYHSKLAYQPRAVKVNTNRSYR
jgi:hypothetical protein